MIQNTLHIGNIFPFLKPTILLINKISTMLFILLTFLFNWKLPNQFTLYNLIFALMSTLFLITVFNILLPDLPINLFTNVNIVLGYVSSIGAIIKIYFIDPE